MGLSIDIAVEHEAWHALGDLDLLAARAAAAVTAQTLVPDGAEWSVVLADDAFVQALNARWRGKDRPTNVLSFPTDVAQRSRTLGQTAFGQTAFGQTALGGMSLGDVVVAWETSAHEAAERGWTMPDYLTHLLVHGLCHLVGFDHETDEEADAMEDIEARALASLGIASPFRTAAEAAP